MHKYLFAFFTLLAIASLSYADGWVPVNPTGDVPAPVFGHTMVEMNGEFYLFGGQTLDGRGLLNTLHTCNASQNSWKKVTPLNDPPEARQGHAAVVYDKKMYVFFGQGNAGALSDIWAYDYVQNRWEKQTTSSQYVPQARLNHAAVTLGDKVYLLGGKTASGNQYFEDLWAFNFADKTWAVEGYFPSGPTFGHSMAAAGTRIYIYGGQNTSGFSSETWYYDIAQKSWRYTAPGTFPQARRNSVTVQNLENMWVYGGLSETRAEAQRKDIWQYNFATNVWTQKADGPVAQSQSAGILLPQANGQDVSVFVFGGVSPQGPVNTTWQYYSSPEPPDPPQPSKKEVLAQIGALGKGKFALYLMSFDKDQAKVKLDIQWLQEKSKLKLFTLRLPFMMRGENPELCELEQNLESFHLGYLKHFERVDIEQEKQQGRQTLTHTLGVKRGTLLVMVAHQFFTPTARDIQFKVSEFTDLPKKVQYVFSVGDPDNKGLAQNHFVQFPVVPTRWHSHYPNGANGKENVESSTNLWKWNYTEQKSKFSLLPFAWVKFELP